AAVHLGMETIPAIVEDVPDQLASERALRDNAQWGEWLEDDLAALLANLRQDGSDLSIVGLNERELQQLLDRLSQADGMEDPDTVPPLAEEPISKPGDLYLLGDHRLLCGDATNRDHLLRLLGSELATCVWTDPP